MGNGSYAHNSMLHFYLLIYKDVSEKYNKDVNFKKKLYIFSKKAKKSFQSIQLSDYRKEQ